MAAAFDPYHKWLGIPPSQQPPTYYRLLGLEPFEGDRDVIESAANQRFMYLQELSCGEFVKEQQRLLNEISKARRTLLSPVEKAAYDGQLRAITPAAFVAVPFQAGKLGVPLVESAPAEANPFAELDAFATPPAPTAPPRVEKEKPAKEPVPPPPTPAPPRKSPPAPVQKPPAPVAGKPGVAPKASKKPLLIGGAAVAGLLVVGVAAWAILGGTSPATPGTAPPTGVKFRQAAPPPEEPAKPTPAPATAPLKPTAPTPVPPPAPTPAPPVPPKPAATTPAAPATTPATK